MTLISKGIVFISGRLVPRMVFSRYARIARRQGLDRPYFVLSLDCDTELDTGVAIEVYSRLKEIGIQPVYAVCGEVLKSGAEVYKRISNSGAEFINHGYHFHTRFNRLNMTYEGTLFYDKLSEEEIISDIRMGHDTHLSVLGKAPCGFRTPHFGTFQGDDQLVLLHRTIKDLGYLYSSSTMPLNGLAYGPLRLSDFGIYELASGGWFDKPDLILDSWGFRYDPNRKVGGGDYVKQFRKMLDFFLAGNRPALLNYYVDPSQVFDWEPFFECMKSAAPIAAPSYNYLLKEVLKCH